MTQQDNRSENPDNCPENWDEKFKRAEAERDARRKKQQAEKQARPKKPARGKPDEESGLTRIGGTFSELPLHPEVFARLGGQATRQAAEWTCPTCGESPKVHGYANGFIPGKCSCQIAAMQLERAEKERIRAEQERMEIWKRQQVAHRYAEQMRGTKCYSWLGEQWTPEGLEEMTFDNFEYTYQPRAVKEASDFARERRGNLILWGETNGTGKTHLAAAICNYLVEEQGVSCRFATAQNLFHAFGARMDHERGYSDLLIEAGSTSLLVLDDISQVHLTPFKKTIFSEIIDLRYTRRLPTVITTNAYVDVTPYDVIGLSEYLGRAATSRLCDVARGGLTVVELAGEDYRRRARGER